MDGLLFSLYKTKTQQEKQFQPSSFPSFPSSLSPPHTLPLTHPLVAAAGFVDGCDHLQVKGGVQMAVLPLLRQRLRPEQRQTRRDERTGEKKEIKWNIKYPKAVWLHHSSPSDIDFLFYVAQGGEGRRKEESTWSLSLSLMREEMRRWRRNERTGPSNWADSVSLQSAAQFELLGLPV